MITESTDAPLLLIVEDNPDHSELMVRSLEDAGDSFRLVLISSFREAQLFLEKNSPDLILTDYRLPDGDGSALVPLAYGRFPVVMMTSQGNEQVAVEAMKAGMLDYVVKSSAVFSGISRIVQRGLREWGLIQEQKRAEDELQRMERQLLHVQKLESLITMSSGIAHDFNNLLQALLGNLELALLKLPEDSSARKFITQANEAAERASKLSAMMLAYSGKGYYNKQQRNLNTLIENSLALLTAAISRHIAFNFNPVPVLPDVMADSSQIQQVLINLLTNASEAIGDASGTITLSTGKMFFEEKPATFTGMTEPKLPSGWYVWFDVTDNGCGMDQSIVNKIFDPFFTTKFTGRGLGMSSVQGIVHAHQGGVMIESKPGKGTTVRVLLPIATL